jgi:hypothetical protein
MSITKEKYMEEEAKKYCQCVEPVIEGSNEDGFYCWTCKKDIFVPDYEPEYNGDEDLGNNGDKIDTRTAEADDSGDGEIAGYRGGDTK